MSLDPEARIMAVGRSGGVLSTIVRGVLWTSGAQIGRQGMQLLTMTVLARLLLPSDFGLLAMVSVINAFAALFVEMGFGAALVQRPDLSDRHLTSVFWVTAAVGATIALILAAGAPVVAAFYQEPVLTHVTRVLSVQLFAAGLGVVPRALLIRAHDFRGIAVVELWATAVGGGAALVVTTLGAGIWGLVTYTLATTGLSTAGYFARVRPWRPGAAVSLEAVRQLLGFSVNLLGFNVVNYWARNADNLLIGRVLGSSQLGAYSLSYQIMVLPIQHVPNVFGQVMFPILSSLHDSPDEARKTYKHAVQVIALISFPLMTILCISAPELVDVVLGAEWSRVSGLLRILAVAGLAQTVGVTVGWIWQAMGRTDVMFRWGVFASVATVLSIVTGLRWQVEGVATCYALCIVVLTPLSLHIAGSLIRVTLLDFARVLAPPGIAAVMMAATGVFVRAALLANGAPTWLVLTGTLASGVTAYLLVVRAMVANWRDALREVVAAARPERVASE